MEESCTLYHAIALLAYGDDVVAQRYGARPGVRASGSNRRRSDLMYPTGSGLPGTERFAGAKDEQELRTFVLQWRDADKTRWGTAKAKLWGAVRSGVLPAFDKDGRIAQEFWLTHDLDSRETQHFRFRRSDLIRLVAEPADDVPPSSKPENGHAASQREPAIPRMKGGQVRLAIPNKPGAGGQKTAAAIEAMVCAVKEGPLTLCALRRMKQKELVTLYPQAGRTTLTAARERALRQLSESGYSDKNPT